MAVAMIDAEFLFKMTDDVESLTAMWAGATTDGSTVDAGVNARMSTAMMTALEYASPAPLEDMFLPC